MAERHSDPDRDRGSAKSTRDLESLEKLEAHELHSSDVDAMGQNKRRAVIGHSYGPSKKSQALFFVAVGAVMAILIGGYIVAIGEFDQPEDSYADQAPWSQADAEQIPTSDPANPCGEPGNPYPTPEGSPCATEEPVNVERNRPTSSSVGP